MAGVVLLVLGLVAAAGYYLFTGWRARDLAGKAKVNFEQANYRLAWLQLNSARALRSRDPEVLRVAGLIEGAMGQATALESYEQLAAKTTLTPEDLLARAQLVTRFGNEEQFTAALEALEASGQATEAGGLRTARQLRQGDLDRALTEARRAADTTGDAALRLSLARLLVQRFAPEFARGAPSTEALAGSSEAVQIINGLLETPRRGEALAFALNELETDPQVRLAWARAAMADVAPGNPALLPAAVVLVRAGEKSPQQIHDQLRPVFDAAPLDRRASLALWLSGAGLPKEALTLITAQEAGESTAAFGARTEALFRLENLDAVLAAVDAGGNIDADVRLIAKARAEYARGRGAQGGATALREAMDTAAQSRRLEFILPGADALGALTVVDEKLAELSGNPAVADYVFRVARDRFSRRGRVTLLAVSFERARTASPQSAGVQDYLRYRQLLDGAPVGLDETAAAVAAEPANATFRITHALNLLRRDEPAAALEVFDDITIFADRLPPGQLAVIGAVLAANGDMARARAVAATIDADRLVPGEYALVLPLRAGAPAIGE